MVELPPPPSEVPAAPPKRSRGRWGWLVALASLLIVAGAAGATVMQNADDDGATASGPAISPSSSPVPPKSPANLRAKAGAFQVALSWRLGEGGGPPPDHYDIQRNDEVIGHAKASATSWVDDDVVPGEHYAYQVIAVGQDDRRSRSSVDVTTKKAPPGTAALVGTFDVKFDATSHTGYASFGNARFSGGWRFQPVCDRPPCNTQLRDIHDKKFTLTLDQTEGTYTGSVTTTGFGTCNGHHTTSMFTVTLHITQADDVRGAWQVTKFTGTMSEYASAQLGCTSASSRFDLAGTALKR